MSEDCLVEIGSGELPPKALKKLANAFRNEIASGLKKAEVTFAGCIDYAAPRRLAVYIKELAECQPTRNVQRRGPAVKQAFNENGEATPACLGFARSCGVEVDALQREKTDKGEWLSYQVEQTGQQTLDLIPGIIEQALQRLPIPKRMRWGSHDSEFVRPVHWVLMLYGNQVLPATLFGHQSDRLTYGHRFHHPQAIEVAHPEEYLKKLQETGKVIACFNQRQEKIKQQVSELTKQVNAVVNLNQALLDEVTGLVEWPVGLLVNFDKRFLDVPAEALISSMHDHQKCFELNDKNGNLLPHFITISNIDSNDTKQVIRGNEKVMTARLADAEFFYQTDLKHPLASYTQRLKHVVFQEKLGSLHDKTTRIAQIAEHIANKLKSDVKLAKQAGELCKNDLMTEMVGEFPELQGIMGYYYATHEKLSEEVALSLREHYLPRFAGDSLPSNPSACACALADKIDTLVGIFGINQLPSGEKDPFALRRAALGVLRIIIEKQLPLDLYELITFAHQTYQGSLPNNETVEQCFTFILERLRAWYQEQHIASDVFAAVMAKKPHYPLDFELRIQAVTEFRRLPEAAALAAANKRVSKLLIKENSENIDRKVDQSLFENDSEQTLAKLIEAKREQVEPLYQQANYNQALSELADLRDPVDKFFDNVMVMVDDTKIRHNRLALLANLRDLFLHVADISVLQ